MLRAISCVLVVALCVPGATLAADVLPTTPYHNARSVELPGVLTEGLTEAGLYKMPWTGLTPAKYVPGLCVLKYPIGTASPEAQQFFDQGLGYYYSYVWMEAARCFETAVHLDPECPMAWWGLSRALEKYGRRDLVNKALQKADELKGRASWREQQLILASMQTKGLAPNVGDAEARKKAAINTLDNLLAVHDDDTEAWYFRAQMAGGEGLFGGQVGAVPFYKALLRVDPLHPGANHELVHFYENLRRPALGMPYADAYIESSPGIPHPFHMQAHLATRIGRWDKTATRSARAVELERAYHTFLGVKPGEDQQYSHHLEILLLGLIHDGRFREANEIQAEMEKNKLTREQVFFKLHLAERDFAGCEKILQGLGRRDKIGKSYLTALLYLKKGETQRALAELEVLQQAARDRKNDQQIAFKLWEVQGLYLCATGSGEAGLKLLAKAVEKTKDDFSHHAWGNGAYYMEAWGEAALRCGNDKVAEEAYLEAIAHDPGCVRAALGMQVLCEKLDRTEEAQRFAELARKCWARADAGKLEAELAALRAIVHPATSATAKPAGE
jgi:tetratricopeptide (TPR) repeat protein